MLDVVQRVTPMKTKESTPAIGNSETNTKANQEHQTNPKVNQETQLTANTTRWKLQMQALIPSLTLTDIQEMKEKGILSIEDIG